ncbi:hypothetical protein [Paenibacillus sp. SI8]|uniref:hypothetical protein n=1 Tax=unclassified Paenibacillus TaxID=185978 RepID=UPI003465CDF9
MSKQVQTEVELQLFNQIVEETWREKGYEVEYGSLESDCFIIYDADIPIGTIEFKPVTMTSEILNYFPFLLPQNTVELDKVSILKNYRSQENLMKLMDLLIRYSQTNHVEKYIGLTEPSFFHFLKNHMKFPIVATSKPFMYKGDHVIPAISSIHMIPKAGIQMLSASGSWEL